MNKIPIKMKSIKEFAFKNFSVYYDNIDSFWFLETYNEDDNLIRVIVEDKESINFDTNDSTFKKIGFTKQNFQHIKNFEKQNKGVLV